MSSFPYSHVKVIANPIAGRGCGPAIARELATALAARGAVCDVHMTSAKGDGRKHAAAIGPSVDLVVVVGGDGTLSEVLSGLPRRDVVLGLLPLGTANVLSLDLALPRDVAGFVALAEKGRTQAVDTARVNGSMLSFLVCGIGFDACVVRELEARRSGPITKRHWFAAGWRAFRTWSGHALEVEIDGEPVAGQFGQVLVSNIVHYGGFDVLQRDRKLDDGLFEVYLFAGRSRLSLLGHLARGAIGRFPARGVTMQRARRVIVRSNSPAPFEIDGDLRGTTPFELVVDSVPFRILVP